MVDSLTPAHRSWNMSRIRSRDTNPERILRSLLHRRGFRFRLNSIRLPGNPDIVLTRYRAVVFVHGCFWHRHSGCRYAYSPKSNLHFWDAKFAKNVVRDRIARRLLRLAGWRVFVVWECQIQKDPERTAERLSTLIRS
jgi:DNA mismatch endonuclease (patch repair protein)